MLTITNEMKTGTFKFEKDSYELAGTFKVDAAGALNSVESGTIVKNGNRVGGFSVYPMSGQQAGGTSPAVNLVNITPAEMEGAASAVNDLIAALEEKYRTE